jgi:hypothetical protein
MAFLKRSKGRLLPLHLLRVLTLEISKVRLGLLSKRFSVRFQFLVVVVLDRATDFFDQILASDHEHRCHSAGSRQSGDEDVSNRGDGPRRDFEVHALFCPPAALADTWRG